MNIFKVLLSIIDSRVQVYREIKTLFSLKKHGDSASKKRDSVIRWPYRDV